MKKQLVLLFVLLLAGQTLLACGDPADDTDTTTTAASDDDIVTTAPIETESLREYADLPEKDYNGSDAKVLVAYNVETGTANYGVSKSEFGATEENADPINDARFKRDSAVEDMYNVNLVNYDFNVEKNLEYVVDQLKPYLEKMLMAGDNDYMFMLLPGYVTCTMAEKGQLQDIASMENIDLSRAWWDQKANADLTVMDRLYYTTGDISTADNDATCTVLFNKVIAEDYDLPDIYSLVAEGKWSFDRFYEMCNDVSKDVNGDGAYDDNDRYGAMIWDDIAMAVANSTGVKCASTDKDGAVVMTLNDERVADVLDKFYEFGRDTSRCFQYQRGIAGVENVTDNLATKMFSNNQVLFFMQLLQIVPKLRDMEADFGIIPLPKYDENQDSYYNTVGSWHSVFYCMPVGTADLEMSTILAEALACESKYTVTEAYYDVNLKTKAARDEESAAMLDIIFESRVYDLGWYYQFGGYNERVMDLFRLNKKAGDFASMYARYTKQAEKKVAELNELFASMEN